MAMVMAIWDVYGLVNGGSGFGAVGAISAINFKRLLYDGGMAERKQFKIICARITLT